MCIKWERLLLVKSYDNCCSIFYKTINGSLNWSHISLYEWSFSNFFSWYWDWSCIFYGKNWGNASTNNNKLFSIQGYATLNKFWGCCNYWNCNEFNGGRNLWERILRKHQSKWITKWIRKWISDFRRKVKFRRNIEMIFLKMI